MRTRSVWPRLVLLPTAQAAARITHKGAPGADWAAGEIALNAAEAHPDRSAGAGAMVSPGRIPLHIFQ